MKYQFNTTATMKEADCKKWWIDSKIIPQIVITADSLKDALKKYAEKAEKDHYISVSETALKNKSAMYIDSKGGESKQVGYVITGKTGFDNDHGQYIDKYIDLWIDVNIIELPKEFTD